MHVVKLYVMDENSNEVGRFVLDVDHLIRMYCKALSTNPRLKDDKEVVFEADSAPADPNDPIVKVVDFCSVYRRKLSNGSVYLHFNTEGHNLDD